MGIGTLARSHRGLQKAENYRKRRTTESGEQQHRHAEARRGGGRGELRNNRARATSFCRERQRAEDVPFTNKTSNGLNADFVQMRADFPAR